MSDPVSSFGSSVQGYKFPKNVVAADFQMCCFALVFEVLRIGPDGVVAVEMTPFTYICPAVNADMGIQDATGSYIRMGADSAVGADMSFRRDLTGLVYNCCRMYGHQILEDPFSYDLAEIREVAPGLRGDLPPNRIVRLPLPQSLRPMLGPSF